MASEPEADAPWSAAEQVVLARLRLDLTLRPDPSNRFADDPAAARLGEALFFDGGLSPHGISCASCHQPNRYFTDGRPRAQGVGEAARHTPTLVGSQWGAWFFWDGRADSLWSQALGPIASPVEMGSDPSFVTRHVAETYGAEWTAVFGAVEDPVGTFVQVGKALAAYERTLLPGEAPFDRYVDAVIAGDPSGGGHLGAAQVRGLGLFLREGCVHCHDGPMFTDRAFHNLGLPEDSGYDWGRTQGAMWVLASPFNCAGPWSDTAHCPELRYLDPNARDFVSAFKTPTLRNVAETAPYMHHGAFASLETVLDFYSELPGSPPAGHRELTLRPLRLSERAREDLAAFLVALTQD